MSVGKKQSIYCYFFFSLFAHVDDMVLPVLYDECFGENSLGWAF